MLPFLLVLLADLSLAAFRVAGFFMPHVRSPASRLARHERAVRRGYLAPRPVGSRHILLEDAIAPRVKLVASSLSLHRARCLAVGGGVHSANVVVVVAKGLGAINQEEYNTARSAHRAANAAKHAWDVWPSSGSQSRRASLSDSDEVVADQLFNTDPWNVKKEREESQDVCSRRDLAPTLPSSARLPPPLLLAASLPCRAVPTRAPWVTSPVSLSHAPGLWVQPLRPEAPIFVPAVAPGRRCSGPLLPVLALPRPRFGLSHGEVLVQSVGIDMYCEMLNLTCKDHRLECSGGSVALESLEVDARPVAPLPPGFWAPRASRLPASSIPDSS